MIYVQKEILIRVGHSGEYLQVARDVLPIAERCGWKLQGAYGRVIGNTISVADRNVIEFWEVPDTATIQTLLDDPDYLALADRIEACLSKEVTTLFRAFDVPGADAFPRVEWKDGKPPLYQHASLNLKRGSREKFRELIAHCVPLFGKSGWKLLGSYSSLTGPNDSIVDFWEIPDSAAIEDALHNPELMPLLPKIHANIMDETFTIMTPLPIREG